MVRLYVPLDEHEKYKDSSTAIDPADLLEVSGPDPRQCLIILSDNKCFRSLTGHFIRSIFALPKVIIGGQSTLVRIRPLISVVIASYSLR